MKPEGLWVWAVGTPWFCSHRPWEGLDTVVMPLVAMVWPSVPWGKARQAGAQGRASPPPCESLTHSVNSSNCEQNPMCLYLMEPWHKTLRLKSGEVNNFRMFIISFPIFFSSCYIVKLPLSNRMLSTAREPTKLAEQIFLSSISILKHIREHSLK